MLQAGAEGTSYIESLFSRTLREQTGYKIIVFHYFPYSKSHAATCPIALKLVSLIGLPAGTKLLKDRKNFFEYMVYKEKTGLFTTPK